MLHQPHGRRATWRFARHYLEMVLAMLVGMAAYSLVSTRVDFTDRVSLEIIEMGLWMTVPMIVWMRVRAHSRRATAEMGVAMLLPTLLVVSLLGGSIVTDRDQLVMIEHTVMLPAMLVAMLMRRDEYMSHVHGRHRSTEKAPHAVGGDVC